MDCTGWVANLEDIKKIGCDGLDCNNCIISKRNIKKLSTRDTIERYEDDK